jgi:hypothetical protein
MSGKAQVIGRRWADGRWWGLSLNGESRPLITVWLGVQVPPGPPRAGVAELVDALDLGSSGASCGGPSPSARTKVCSHDVGRTREEAS